MIGEESKRIKILRRAYPDSLLPKSFVRNRNRMAIAPKTEMSPVPIASEMHHNLDPNALIVPNGNFFGLPYSLEEASVILLPVPWDATTSYGWGTADGPQAILTASVQLDWYDFDVPAAWKIGYGTVPIDSEIRAQSRRVRQIVQKVIAHLERGGRVADRAISAELAAVNQASEALNDWVRDRARTFLAQGKLVGIVGGDHSVPLGLMQALAERGETYGILHIDAHADLRRAYEGFTYSHASIMYHAVQLPAVSHLVQVGIRDSCPEEMERAAANGKITLFDDWQLKANAYQGVTWAAQCDAIAAALPQNVYVSFDVDGLDPRFCPHTGTPVPGGLDFNQVIYLLQAIVKAGKTIIGFDLCEVAPGPSDEWDGNVGARLLYKLANLMSGV